VLTALNYALRSRNVRAGELIFHSDKGAQSGLNWSSQHLDHGGGAWEYTSGSGRPGSLTGASHRRLA